MATLTERVVLDKASPTRSFGNLVELELREDGTAITGTVSQAVLTCTAAAGTVTTYESGTDFALSWISGVLSLDLSDVLPAAGYYTTELDVYVDGAWFRWTLTDKLVLVAE